MPELPEVETIKNDLLPLLTGRHILSVHLAPDPRGSRVLRRAPSPQRLCLLLRGRKILDITRRGKYLLFRLDNAGTLVIHLGMSGRLFPESAGNPLPPHTRIYFKLQGKRRLVFVDPRKFGEVFFLAGEEAEPPRLGPEPFDEDFTARRLEKILQNRKALIKAVLLDQKAIAGLGNIYSDEALFRAGIHPLRPAASLSRQETVLLHRQIRKVLKEAIASRGTTAADRGYVDGKGLPGNFQLRLKVYQRHGRPCSVCRASIQTVRIAGRSAHFCPSCQPLPGCA